MYSIVFNYPCIPFSGNMARWVDNIDNEHMSSTLFGRFDSFQFPLIIGEYHRKIDSGCTKKVMSINISI